MKKLLLIFIILIAFALAALFVLKNNTLCKTGENTGSGGALEIRDLTTKPDKSTYVEGTFVDCDGGAIEANLLINEKDPSRSWQLFLSKSVNVSSPQKAIVTIVNIGNDAVLIRGRRFTDKGIPEPLVYGKDDGPVKSIRITQGSSAELFGGDLNDFMKLWREIRINCDKADSVMNIKIKISLIDPPFQSGAGSSFKILARRTTYAI